jgi:hypothetical protein
VLRWPGTRFAIVSTIRHDARDLALDLLEQDRHLAGVSSLTAGQRTRGYLAGLGINRGVQLAPGPASSAVLLAVPLALSEQLQTRAVEQQVQGTVWGTLRPAIGEAATTPAPDPMGAIGSTPLSGRVKLLNHPLGSDHASLLSSTKEHAAVRTDLNAIFVSLELSRSTWVITSLAPGGGEKMSKHPVRSGDISSHPTAPTAIRRRLRRRRARSHQMA